MTMPIRNIGFVSLMIGNAFDSSKSSGKQVATTILCRYLGSSPETKEKQSMFPVSTGRPPIDLPTVFLVIDLRFVTPYRMLAWNLTPLRYTQ